MIAYIVSQGSTVRRSGSILQVEHKNGSDTLFPDKLEQVLAFGNVNFTHNACSLLLRKEIDTVFLTRNGRYLGRLGGNPRKNVFLRKRQVKFDDDLFWQKNFAKSVVTGKIHNMRTLLLRIGRSREGVSVRNQVASIDLLLDRLFAAESVAEIRGYEGKATAEYFSAFGQGFTRDWGFRRRVRRPPTDPVNSVLSLVYTLLMNRVHGAVSIAGLDPAFGALHALDYGRHSLVLDLMEEWRTIVADTLTLSLFNLGILKQEHFQMHDQVEDDDDEYEQKGFSDAATPLDAIRDDPLGGMSPIVIGEAENTLHIPEQRMTDEVPDTADGKRPVILVPTALKRVIEAFEAKLETEFAHPAVERKITYGEAMIVQARRYRTFIEGDVGSYEPLRLR